MVHVGTEYVVPAKHVVLGTYVADIPRNKAVAQNSEQRFLISEHLLTTVSETK